MARRTRRSPPRLPSLRAEPIDADCIRTERDPGARCLHHGAVPADSEGRRHVADGVLGFEPIHEPRGALHPEGELPHAVFLQRVADEPATSPEVRLGQGAFLALRFVDLLAPDREPPTPDVFRYQWAATERYCAELAGEGTEAAHLSCIVRATGEAHRTKDIHSLAPALFAYALYLEQESHFEEAEDALHTMITVGGERLKVSDSISAWMRLGRVRRLQADFANATVAYGEAGRIAQASG